MVLKIKYHFKLILTSSLFVILFFTCHSCFAFTEDYIKFTFDCCLDDTTNALSSSTKTKLQTYLNSSSSIITDFTSLLNTYASTYSMPSNDLNLIVFTNTDKIDFIISNCSFGSSSVGFLGLKTPSNNFYSTAIYGGGSILVVEVYNITNTNMRKSTYTSLSSINVKCSSYSYYNNSDFVLTLANCYNYVPTQSIYFAPLSKYVQLNNNNYTYTIANAVNPEVPSGDNSSDVGLGDITNPSGDNTGNINLQPIREGINNIQNQISGDSQRIIDNQNQNTQIIVNTISGEVGKITNTVTSSADFNNKTITSGDIEEALGFDFMADPYDNFWYEMTQGLKTSLTGSVRKLPVNWLGYNGYFDLDGLINYPQPIINILTTVSTVCMVWILVKWWKIIIDKLTSGDMDEVLAMNEEERYC